MLKKTRLLILFLVLPALIFRLPVLAGEKASGDKTGPKPIDILAKYAAEAKFEDFPAEVVKRTKYLILDNIGCVLGATKTEVGKKYLTLACSMGGGNDVTLAGSGDRVSCLTAAYVSGQLANILDFDDTYDFYGPAHPGNGIVQTALALSEAVGASGKEMLTAVIVGYESCMHVGRAAGSIFWETPFIYPFALGTAVTAAKLLQLEQKQVAGAICQAGLWSSPPERRKFDVESNLHITDVKNNAGSIALQGILAAYRAQQGFQCREHFLECDFKKWFLAGGELKDYNMLIAGPGKTYRILDVSFKPTPSCRFSHPAVTALWQALDHQPVKEEDVKEIIFKGVVRLDHPKWENALQAQFSMYCILSLTALGVEPGPEWYVTGRFNDPDVRSLSKKIKLENDPEAEKLEMRESKFKCTVKVVFKDGTSKEATISHAKGAPGNPMTEKELQAKFRANTKALFPKARVTKIVETILSLERVPRLSTLTKLLTSEKLRKK
jgi:2-methylcitrate dehydratase PrpD